ncbi:hypothetical protein [Pseudomonas japonica]|uniref:Carbohydrate binding domain-containing protein n=1 Tax=Pseudomonas japonica TaxID=256466 RepID=A0A239EPY3_9PSED|nr:hypothetical protein [Pseudomonas japonica]SNS46308.1 hypothetical protein SAMN05444352_10896 [Pseudomonas japonica]
MNTTRNSSRAEQIRNGDFSNGGINWLTYGDVNFNDQRCNVGVNGVAAQPILSIPPGRYRLSCRAALVTAGGFPGAQLRLSYNTVNTIIDITSTTPTTHEVDLDIPAGIGNMEIYLEGQTAAAWFDDVSLDFAPQSEELIQNGDFSAGGEHWELTGANFDAQTCALRMDDVSQTVAVPTLGYYQLTARAKVGAGSMGRLQVKLLPDGATQYVPVSSTDWSDYAIDITAIQGESAFKVSLIRVTGDDVQFDDVSLKLTAGLDD